MSALRIDRLSLRVEGVSAETVQRALDGLDTHLLERLSVRGIDISRLGDLSAIRLPSISAAPGLDAEVLRARIADGLVDWMMRAPGADKSDEEKL